MARSLKMNLRVNAAGPRGNARVNTIRFLANPALYALDRLAEFDGPIVPVTSGNGAVVIARGAGPLHRFFTDTTSFARPADGVLALPQGHPWSQMTQSMVTLNGPPHRQRRKIVLPVLGGRALAAYEPVFRATMLASRFATSGDKPFDVVAEFRRIARENMLVCIFGLDPTDANQELAELLTGLLGELLSPAVLIVRGGWGWTPYGRCLNRIRRAYDRLADIIERRRIQPVKPDALSLLCHARTETGAPLTTAAIAGELTGLFEGGYETTASAMTWSMLTGLYHPEAARQEMGGLLNETQRLIPTAPASLPRRVLHDIRFDGSVLVPAGAMMFASPVLEHLNPAVYPEPRKFRPGRWSPGFRPPPHAFFPFGTGYRRCVGARFAEQQLVASLALALEGTKWDLLTDDIDYGVHNGIVSLPREPVFVRCGRGRVPPRLNGSLTRMWAPQLHV